MGTQGEWGERTMTAHRAYASVCLYAEAIEKMREILIQHGAKVHNVYVVSCFVRVDAREIYVDAEVDQITRAVVILDVTDARNGRHVERSTLAADETRAIRDEAIKTAEELWAA